MKLKNMIVGGGKSFDLQLVSKHRGALMGFAIIIIVFYHFFNCGGDTMLDKILRKCFSHGYTGVDIFMVVSGLGLTFSMSNSENLKEYYLKRWVRIFPFFTFITLIECWLIRGESFGLALLRSTTIGYWTGVPYIDWYVPAIVGLYAIYPLLYFNVLKPKKLQNAFGLCTLFLGISFIIAIIEWYYDCSLMDWKHYCLVYRVPDFVLGCIIALGIKNGFNPEFVKKFIIGSTLTGVILFVALRIIYSSHCYQLLNLCLTPLYLWLLCNLFERLSKCGCILGQYVHKATALMGIFTLELYRVSSSFERLLSDETCPQYHYLYVMLYFIISLILAYLCCVAFKYINDFLYRKLRTII